MKMVSLCFQNTTIQSTMYVRQYVCTIILVGENPKIKLKSLGCTPTMICQTSFKKLDE